MAISSPFPPEIAFALAAPGEFVPPPLPAERALLSASAAEARVAEFTRGRHCARLSLAAICWPNADSQVILRSGTRAPRWPDGLVGAITHSRGWAAAAVAWAEAFAGVGLDLETVRDPSPALVRRIALPEEREWLAGFLNAERAHYFSLLFSAKESIYKALNPATGVFLGYQDAQVWFAEAPDRVVSGAGDQGIATGSESGGALRWELRAPAGAAYPEGYAGQGGWRADGERVLTGVWVPRRG